MDPPPESSSPVGSVLVGGEGGEGEPHPAIGKRGRRGSPPLPLLESPPQPEACACGLRH